MRPAHYSEDPTMLSDQPSLRRTAINYLGVRSGL